MMARLAVICESDVEDGAGTFLIGFDELPRLIVGQVFVSQPGQVHGRFQCFAETEMIEIVFNRFFQLRDLCQRFLVAIR